MSHVQHSDPLVKFSTATGNYVHWVIGASGAGKTKEQRVPGGSSALSGLHGRGRGLSEAQRTAGTTQAHSEPEGVWEVCPGPGSANGGTQLHRPLTGDHFTNLQLHIRFMQKRLSLYYS